MFALSISMVDAASSRSGSLAKQSSVLGPAAPSSVTLASSNTVCGIAPARRRWLREAHTAMVPPRQRLILKSLLHIRVVLLLKLSVFKLRWFLAAEASHRSARGSQHALSKFGSSADFCWLLLLRFGGGTAWCMALWGGACSAWRTDVCQCQTKKR